MKKINIDICIPTKNSVKTLPRLLQSIEDQNEKIDFRVLIADNNSCDGTIELLNSYTFCEIVSYKDKNPEEGLNKLLNKDSENFKIIVGADDYLSKNYLKSFIEAAYNLNKRGIKKFIILPLFYKSLKGFLLNIDFPLPIFFLNFIGISRGIGFGIFNSEGNIMKYNINTKFASDFDFLIKCKKDNYYFKYVPARYFFYKGGRSSKNWQIAFEEERQISLKYNKTFILKIFIKFLFKFKFLVKRLNQFVKSNTK
tara:strand:+ start:4545 stop:5306 length:762 start_codon:yes stop_codon:yes gene_type:complete